MTRAHLWAPGSVAGLTQGLCWRLRSAWKQAWRGEGEEEGKGEGESVRWVGGRQFQAALSVL